MISRNTARKKFCFRWFFLYQAILISLKLHIQRTTKNKVKYCGNDQGFHVLRTEIQIHLNSMNYDGYNEQGVKKIIETDYDFKAIYLFNNNSEQLSLYLSFYGFQLIERLPFVS